MCVAAPFQIIRIDGHRATLRSEGVVIEADISLVTPVEPGEYVLVHAGFAITKLTSDDAEERLELFREFALGDPR